MTPFGGPPPAATTYRFSTDTERDRRLGALRSLMADRSLTALVVCGRDDIRYRGRAFWVSDVWQLVADAHVVVLPEGPPIFIGGQVFGLEQAELSDWVPERRINGNAGQEIALTLADHGAGSGTVGVVGLSDASFAAWHLQEMQAGCPDVSFVDATELFELARQTNSDEELAAYQDTSDVMKAIYAELEPMIRPGITEMDLASAAHRASRAHGLRDPMVLMQTTPYGAIGFGTTKEITRDDLVTLWIESAGPSGYWVEYRRCYSFGEPSSDAARFWDLQVAATNAGLARLVPGAMASEFVIGARDLINDAGFDFGYTDYADDHYMFSLHGIGTDAIQGVWVPGNDRVLAESEVVNIHLTLDFSHEDLAKYGWLGITDNAIVTPAGGVVTTSAANFSDGFIDL